MDGLCRVSRIGYTAGDRLRVRNRSGGGGGVPGDSLPSHSSDHDHGTSPRTRLRARSSAHARMNAGYSKRSLREKLGLRTSMRYAILHAPSDYEETLGMPFQE